jgi:glycosyltransferase involved in cell wall biosynthesis
MRALQVGLNAHLLSRQAGYRRAGINGYIYHLLAHLPSVDPNIGFRVFVGEGDPPPAQNVTVRRATINTASPSKRILWEQAIQPFQVGGLDLMHQLAFAAPLMITKPFVVTIHDLTFIRYPNLLKASRRLYLRLFTTWACQHARRIIAVSEATADDLVSLMGVPRQRITVIQHGIDRALRPLPPDEVAAWRDKTGLPKRFLFYLGTLEPRKNLPTLVKAYAALPSAERIPLILAGGRGWMNESLDAALAEARRAGADIRTPGYIPDEALIWWYNAAETFVYPSLFEGWGMPISEALACGKPALVSDISSLPEAVGPTGLKLPPHDVQAWVDGLRHAIQDSAWRESQGEAGRAFAAQFTWERTAQQTVSIYRSV